MSSEFKDDGIAPPDLRWGRIELVSQLQGLLSTGIDKMVIHMTDEFDVVRIKSGRVLPLEAGGTPFYTGLTATVLGFMTERREWAEVQFSDASQEPHEYDLVLSAESLDLLENDPNGREIAWRDSHTTHKLGRAIFSKTLANEALRSLMLNPDKLQQRINRGKCK